MTSRYSQDHLPQLRLPVVHGRTRVAVAVIGFLLSLGVPAVMLSGGPVPTVDGHAVGRLDDPAGLGVTGALPGDKLPSSAVAGDGVPGDGVPGSGVPGSGAPRDFGGAGSPGIPTPPDLPQGPLGIPGVMLDAYQFAQRTLAATRPGCHLSWPVLAGIGRIESGHASDGRVDAFGNTLGPILGPRLDGSPGVAAIADTDHGQLDGDPVWDRAVGPMQFIPSSWRGYGADGNGDGVANPNNIYDATITTGLYLCNGGTNLADPAQLQAAIFRYNHSSTYVDIVLRWAQAYLTGVVPTPSAPGPVPPGTTGNGGRPIVPDGARPTAPAPSPAAQPTPLASTPPTTSNPPPPPPATPPPATVPVTTPTPPPPATSPPPPASTSRATEPSPLPSPPPATTMSPQRPTPSPSPPPVTS